jgi:hypothetical protein
MLASLSLLGTPHCGPRLCPLNLVYSQGGLDSFLTYSRKLSDLPISRISQLYKVNLDRARGRSLPKAST